MVSKYAPRYAYALATISSFVALTLIIGSFLKFEVADSARLVVPAVCCGLLGLAFGRFWPRRSWLWGFWVSSAFLLYFGVVFFSFTINRQFVWLPALQMLVVAGAGCMGALAGGWLFASKRHEPLA